MKNVKLPAEKGCVLTTAHITKMDAALLEDLAKEDDANLPRVQNHKHGWLVFVVSDKAVNQQRLAALKDKGFSAAFVRLYNLAFKQDFSILDFDSAGELLGGLRHFNW